MVNEVLIQPEKFLAHKEDLHLLTFVKTYNFHATLFIIIYPNRSI
jgi:hypothetical protein